MNYSDWIKNELEGLQRRLSLLLAEHRDLRRYCHRLQEENERLRHSTPPTAPPQAASLKSAPPPAVQTPSEATAARPLSRVELETLDRCIAQLEASISYLEESPLPASNTQGTHS